MIEGTRSREKERVARQCDGMKKLKCAFHFLIHHHLPVLSLTLSSSLLSFFFFFLYIYCLHPQQHDLTLFYYYVSMIQVRLYICIKTHDSYVNFPLTTVKQIQSLSPTFHLHNSIQIPQEPISLYYPSALGGFQSFKGISHVQPGLTLRKAAPKPPNLHRKLLRVD